MRKKYIERQKGTGVRHIRGKGGGLKQIIMIWSAKQKSHDNYRRCTLDDKIP